MFKKLSALTVLIATLLTASYTSAGLIEDVVEIDQRVEFSHSYTHDINDQGFNLGAAESASLAIEISDDDKCNLPLCADEWAPDAFLIVVEDLDFDTGGITFGNFESGLGVKALLALNTDGFLDVTVSSLGDFLIGTSTLTVNTRVPEPGTLVLLVLGLFGLGWIRRNAKA